MSGPLWVYMIFQKHYTFIVC